MNFLLRFLTCIVFFINSFIVFSQNISNTDDQKTTNREVVQKIESKFGVVIYYEQRWLDNNTINFVPETAATVEEALNFFTARTNLNFIKVQENSYALVPKEVLKNILEQRDTLLNENDNLIVIGNINSYIKGKKIELNGIVKNGQNGEPVIGATIYIKSLKLGVVSDSKGVYTISLNPGKYTLNVSSLGFEENIIPIKIISSGELNIELFEKSIKLDEVVVLAQSADRNVNRSQMGIVEIDKKILKQIPPVMGERDIIKSFTMMPGVKSTGEFGTGISVRGGGNDQNLFLLENTPIYNTSHVFGLISALTPDVVENVTMYKGFIPAEYGERVSSVIDIQLKNGNNKKFKTYGGIGILNNRLSFEGPLYKDKVTFIAGGRSSYSNWMLTKIPDEELANSQANFYDLILGLNASVTPNNRVSAFFYNSYDFFNYNKTIEYSNKNTSGEIKWTYYKNSSLYFTFIGNYTNNTVIKNDFEIPSEKSTKEISITSIGIKSECNYAPGGKHAIKAGIQANEYLSEPGRLKPYNSQSFSLPKNVNLKKGLELAAYVSDNYQLNDKISINLGLRYTQYMNIGSDTVYNYNGRLIEGNTSGLTPTIYSNNQVIATYQNLEPRLSLKYQFNTSTSTKISYNKNSQYLSMISASAVPTPDDFWQIATNYIKPVQTTTYAIGLYKNFLNNSIETSIEGYSRELNNLIEIKNGAKLYVNEHIETELLTATGKTYGVELYLKKNSGSVNGWISYTFSRSLKKTSGKLPDEKINNNSYYPSNFDKPHDLNLMLSYNYNRRLRFSFNFSYSTGRAVTLPDKIYKSGDNWLVSYKYRNNERLPDYHRLDFSISFDESLKIKKRWKGSWTLSVINVYARKNAYSMYFKKEVPSKDNNYREFGLYKLYIIGIPFPTLTYNFTF